MCSININVCSSSSSSSSSSNSSQGKLMVLYNIVYVVYSFKIIVYAVINYIAPIINTQYIYYCVVRF
jgi:hypothetical protein